MRTILAQLKQYKKDSILTPLFTALEVNYGGHASLYHSADY